MNIYHISYTTNPIHNNPHKINIDSLSVTKETEKYFQIGRGKIHKRNIDAINSSISSSGYVNVLVYASSLNILDLFKKQVQLALLNANKNMHKYLVHAKENLTEFLDSYHDQHIDSNEELVRELHWVDNSLTITDDFDFDEDEDDYDDEEDTI